MQYESLTPSTGHSAVLCHRSAVSESSSAKIHISHLRRTSLDNVENKWLEEIHEQCPGVKLCLVALKCDLRESEESRQKLELRGEKAVTYEEVRTKSSPINGLANCYNVGSRCCTADQSIPLSGMQREAWSRRTRSIYRSCEGVNTCSYERPDKE